MMINKEQHIKNLTRKNNKNVMPEMMNNVL